MIASYCLNVQEVADTVAAALGGRESGLLYEADRRFDSTVRVPDATRVHLDDIRSLPVLLPEEPGERRRQVPHAHVDLIRFTEGLNENRSSTEHREGKEGGRKSRSRRCPSSVN